MATRNAAFLFLGIAFFFSSCSKQKPAAETTPPAYAKPSYIIPETTAVQSAIQFSDITAAVGIAFTHETGAFGKKWMPETMGSGGGFFDYDNDQRPDIFLVNGAYWPGHEKNNPAPTPRLYRNLGDGRFKDVTAEAGLSFSIYGMGCTFGDFDGDGDADIYLTAVGTNKLLRNDGDRFTDVTSEAGVTGNSPAANDPPAWSTSAAWVDVDRDGRLDLFVCNYVKWTPETDLFTTLDGKNKSYATPEQYQGESCRLYRNLDGKRFKDITERAGVFNPEGKSLGVAMADFNDDGWPDLVVANDTQPNFLYMNNGDGTFTNVALQSGVAYDEAGRARAGMGIDVTDLNNNGKLSIAIGNFAREPVSLYTQINRELFQDLAGSARLAKPTLLMLTFGLLFADFDLDGYGDLAVANGHIEPEINSVQQDITFAQKPQLFRNNGRGQLAEIGEQAGEVFSQPIVGRGIAAADIDNDGDHDLLITVNGGAPKLCRNDLADTTRHWIKIRLQGNAPNLHAVGATVTVWAGEITQKKMVRTASSYLSQSEANPLIFGLGARTQADSIAIRWPTSGKITKLGAAAANQVYQIKESAPSFKPVIP
ncbi:MAG: CRTAC1 family protein [candidate division KSB1 bacterium]|nr:CRTAC1 family protein [candidate division KSB1 bacterium]MDZ7367947.1 CRTAC1 family protein [candidate division KSB1 bacterium]MDZ7405570.1 CRTAC1 family protein [candidate division KSB1 bacterium]